MVLQYGVHHAGCFLLKKKVLRNPQLDSKERERGGLGGGGSVDRFLPLAHTENYGGVRQSGGGVRVRGFEEEQSSGLHPTTAASALVSHRITVVISFLRKE